MRLAHWFGMVFAAAASLVAAAETSQTFVEDLEENQGQKDSWVYTDCRIENTVGASDAYSVQPVPGTNEYCYIFTNAGKTVTFTPRMDLYLSQALVVGGGGAGGWGAGGGGGGGGVYALTNGVWLKAGEPVTITVGSGGNNYFSSLSTSAQIQRGECGGLSRLSIEGEDYTAYGGGGGGSYSAGTAHGNNNNGQASVTLATGGGDTANDSTVPTGLSTKMGLGGGGNGGYGGWGAAGAGGGGAGGNGVSCSTNNIEVLDSTHWLLDLECGDGGIGWASDITGSTVYYGGGGGGGDGRWFTSTINYSGKSYYQYNTGGRHYMIRGSNGSANCGNRRPGNGGQGGGGAGLVAKSASPGQGENGANGYGGGGGGGSSWGGGTYRPGGRGGDGAVILRLAKEPSMKCLIQPACGHPGVPMGLRSPLFTEELSSIRFTCDWADSNMALQLQVSRAMPDVSEVPAYTLELSDNWTTVKTFNYHDISESNGVKMLEYRFPRPVTGLVRLIADPSVVAAALEQNNPSFGLVVMSSVSVTFGTSVRDTLKAGEYFKATLSELGYDVPTNGTAYSVTAYGLPAGLKLVSNKAVTKKVGKKTIVVTPAKTEWWIEGVPTAALDYFTNPPYLAITTNGVTETLALPVEVLAQEVTELDNLALGQSLNEQFYLPGVTNGWTVSGLPTGLKYTAKLVTTKKMKGKKVVSVATNALPYSVYGKTTKAGLFTITAKKKAGAYYETMKYRMLVTPKAPDAAVFGDDLTNITTMAYVPVEWDLTGGSRSVATESGGHAGRVPLPVVSNVVKVAGLPGSVTFASANVYKDKKKTKLKQLGQTIVGTPTKPGTYVVTFTKNVTTGTGKNKKTVAKTAQILWTVTENDAELSLGFNTSGGVIEGGSVGLKYGDLLAFSATSNATVKASGLPAGIKLVRVDGSAGGLAPPGEAVWGFAGFTTKAGTYLVTVTATLNGKTVRQRVALKVDGLPDWAKGSFNGCVWGTGNGEGGTGGTNGLATVTVSSAGKISGKFQEFGTNWTFSASSYTNYNETESMYSATVTAKYAYKVKEKVKGKWKNVTKYLTREFTFDIAEDRGRGFGGVVLMSDCNDEAYIRINASQNLWGRSDYKALGKKIFWTSKKKPYKDFSDFVDVDGTPCPISIKITPNGVVTATLTFDTGKTKKNKKTNKMEPVYYKPSCATVVIPQTAADAEPFRGEINLYFAPSPANNFPGCAPWISKEF